MYIYITQNHIPNCNSVNPSLLQYISIPQKTPLQIQNTQLQSKSLARKISRSSNRRNILKRGTMRFNFLTFFLKKKNFSTLPENFQHTQINGRKNIRNPRKKNPNTSRSPK